MAGDYSGYNYHIEWYPDKIKLPWERAQKKLIATGMKIEREAKMSMRGGGFKQAEKKAAKESEKTSTTEGKGRGEGSKEPGALPGTRKIRVLSAKAAARAARRQRGEPSKPGEPPHRQTGRLAASVCTVWSGGGYHNSQALHYGEDRLDSIPGSPDDDIFLVRVGSNVLYSVFLELGTVKMAPRPWLRRAFLKHAVSWK